MSFILAYPVALAATVPTTLAVLGLWVLYARVVDGDRAETVFLPLLFIFVPLIFFVSAFGNLAAVAIGQVARFAMPELAGGLTVIVAGVLVWLACAWSQRGGLGFGWRSKPVAILPVALFSLADMAILAGGLGLLPRYPIL